ncbi:MAG TPA: superoxide dismutase [Caulobacteraceae bacterium]
MQTQTQSPAQARKLEGAGTGYAEPRAIVDTLALELPPLPYGYDALAPHISEQTLKFHHDKHHRAYIDKTRELVAGTELEQASLPAIIAAARKSDNRKLLSQAGQAWNHTIFWGSMSPNGGGAAGGRIAAMIDKTFGGLAGFKKAFKEEAVSHFGSGWAWLCLHDGELNLTSFHDGDTPAGMPGVVPLLTCDVWEHAYYLDYQNRRAAFVDAYLEHLINWDFAEAIFEAEG